MSPPAAPQALQVVAPFWLDRPAEEAVDIAVQALRAGYELSLIHI